MLFRSGRKIQFYPITSKAHRYDDGRRTLFSYRQECGEEYFRKTECEVIKKAAEMKNVVIATGGGVVLNEQNIENLRKTGVIFNLSPDFSVIRERLEEARKTRPLLKRDSIENIKKRFDDRKPFYDNCDYKIKVIHGRTPRSYAMEILEIMESSQGAGKQ